MCLDVLLEVGLGDEMRSGDVERSERQLELTREPGGIRRQCRELLGHWRHSRVGVGRREGVYTGGCDGVGVAIKFGDGSHVALTMHSAAHDDKFFDTEKCLGVFGSCESDIGQRPKRQNGDGIGRVLLEKTDDLLVSRGLGWGEVGREVVGVNQAFLAVLEQTLPSVRRVELWMGLMDVV